MAKLKITLPADRVLIQPAAAEEKTAGGIIIPDTAKEKPQKGLVVAVGLGKPSLEVFDFKVTLPDGGTVSAVGTRKKDESMTVKVGDEVLYGKYSGTEITIDGVAYLIMKESDIFAII
ncbi:MAG: co-chaperone GroES [Bacteroidetes bacterium]|nr:co-chaperone GroES [Bacteroidota bacterium]